MHDTFGRDIDQGRWLITMYLCSRPYKSNGLISIIYFNKQSVF